MKKTDQILENLKNFLNSKEGEEFIEKEKQKIEQAEKVLRERIAKFHERFGSNPELLARVISKVTAAYDSDSYVRFWYGKGYEPPRPFFFFLLDYAKVHGKKCNRKELRKYGNPFTGSMFKLNNFYVQIMHGQGSMVKVTEA